MALLSRLSFRVKILIGFLLPAMLLGFLALNSFKQVHASLETANWVRHTQEVIARAHLLEKLMVDMETGKRGFMLTGKDHFLEPYYTAEKRWVTEVNTLKALVSDNPIQVQRAVEIAKAADQWMAIAAIPVIELRRKGMGRDVMARIIANTEREIGKNLMDEIRQRVEEFIDVEDGLMVLRVKKAEAVAERTILLSVFVLPLGGCIFLITAAFILLKSVLIPLKNMTGAAEQVADGNLHIHLDVSSNDELGQLAKTFNKMTESLLSSRKGIDIANQALTEKALELEKSNQYKSEFLANMSHEIRTPMNGVIGMLGLLMRCELSDKVRHYANLARSSADILLVVINDILDFSKIEAGKLELEYIDFDLRSQLGEFGQVVAHRAQEKGLEFVLDISSIDVNMVKGDPGRLRQVLSNLVNNAIKFTESGEIVVKARVVPEQGDLRLHCLIRDTGIGIAPERIQHLFEAFTQEDASTTRKYGGTGLGLAIVKQLCGLMDGDISVGSLQGRGSEFSFDILLQSSEVPQIKLPRADISGKRILIVDDNTTNREVLKGQLKLWGANVVESSSGQGALDVLANDDPFAVAILDMQMPEMDGATLGQKIRGNSQFDEMRLIMMTSLAERGDAQKFSDLGFNAYFPKPATPSDLFNALNVVLGNSAEINKISPIVTRQSLAMISRQSAAGDNRVLLVEDNYFNQEVALGMLEDLGITADIAGDGAEAIDALKSASLSDPYTLILMDCQMPILDGYEATRQIRSGEAGVPNPEIPIVAMTANAMKGDKEKCLAAGMSDYLAKPVTHDGIASMLSEWIGYSGVDLTDATEPLGDCEDINEGVSEEMEGHPFSEIIRDERVWDELALMERLRHKKDRVQKIIQLFLEFSKEKRAEFEVCFSDKNTSGIREIAHTIKGTAANLGGDQVEAISKEMEAAARNDDLKGCEKVWPVLDECMLTLCKRLRLWQEDNKGEAS